MRSVVLAMVVCGLAAMVQAQSPAPSIEEVEAQIKAAEEKQAAAEKASREAQARRDSEAARKAEAERQGRVEREAAASAAAGKTTVVIKTDTRCDLTVDGKMRGWLETAATQYVQVEPGLTPIWCNGDRSRVHLNTYVDLGKQVVVQLVHKERFERVAEGVKDRAQNIVWAASDNGSDVNWSQAKQYCTDLGQGWSLATSVQLVSLYDALSQHSKVMTLHGETYTIMPATPLIELTGIRYWSAETKGSSSAWHVYLPYGFRNDFDMSARNTLRALCVRRK